MTDVAAAASVTAPAVAEEPQAVDAPVEAPEAAPEAKPTTDDAKEADTEAKDADISMSDVPEAAAEKADEKPADAVDAPPEATPKKAARRKSAGPKLNRKASKARITHLDAQPGGHYFVKLKGYPAWPVVVCDEDMLPQTLLKSRPVSAARPDGSYREDFADGGKRAADRTFPVMYLFTNEFGWVPNQDMHDLDPATVLDAVNDKMRKDLQQAHQLAAASHPLPYYKDMLRQFADDQAAAAEAARIAQATPKKKRADKADKNGDVDMLDVPMDDDEAAAAAAAAPPKKSKKRKADDEARTPQRADTGKKPKIKITHSGAPKSNGTPSTKAAAKTSEPETPAESEPSPEERLRRKTKEVYFLRHKIQKSLLTRDQEPKADEMKLISEYLAKLEGFASLEVTIIRETKINKVLKAILKLEAIPREDEFQFKPRSQTLLDKWTKLLAAAPEEAKSKAAKAETNGSTNGHAETNGTKAGAKTKEVEAKDEAKEDTAEVSKESEETNGSKEIKEIKEPEPESKAEAAEEPVQEGEKPEEEPAAVEAAA